MAISTVTYVPRFRVRVVGASQVLDSELDTQFKQAIAEINVERRIGSGANFSLSLYPSRINAIGSAPATSWDFRFNPMDYVEISLSDPNAPTNLKIVMRGFISNINRNLDISSGTPQEMISITGLDWEKIAQYPLYFLILNSSTTSFFDLEILNAWYNLTKNLSGSGDINLKPTDIIKAIFDNKDGKLTSLFSGFFVSVAAQVASILLTGTTGAGVELPQLLADAASDPLEISSIYQAINPVAQALASTTGPNTTIMEYFRAYQAAPWRELFFDDYENGQLLIYKTTPWRDIHGTFLQENPSFPSNTTQGAITSIIIGPKDYISFSLGRSDSDVNNAFFTTMLFNEPSVTLSKATGGNGFVDIGKGNPTIVGGKKLGDVPTPSDWRLFGVRFMDEQLIYMDYSLGHTTNQKSVSKIDTHNAQTQILTTNGGILTKLLAAAMDHNELLTSGNITVAGNPNYHIGTYVKFQRNDTVVPSFFYVEGIQHTFRQPSGYSDGAYLSSLIVTRGEDLLDYRYR